MDPVRYEIRGQAAWVTIDRAERRNALDQKVAALLREALERAGAEPAARVIVLTGAGEVFCAGADLQGTAGAGGAGFARGYEDLLHAFGRLPKPVVARVNGAALGGGLGLVLAADLAVAADTAVLGTPEVRVGLFPMMVTALLFRHVGRKRGLEMVFTGEKVPAEEALRLGLLNRVVPSAELDTAVEALVARIADKSPTAIRLGRLAFHRSEDMARDEALTFLRQQLEVNLSTEDAAEGMAAFLDKRPPRWPGR